MRRVLALSLLLAACAPRPAQTTTSSAPASTHPKRGEGAMREVRPTTFASALRADGLDVKSLPPLESLDPKTRLHVMKTFTEALGVACTDCHAGNDFRADTKRKRIAKRMWNQITRVVAIDGGKPVYCDSCHQGALFILDRRVESKVTLFMNDVYDQKLQRTDGRNHDCATCHGDPMDEHFLSKWRETTAPDLDPVTK